MSIYRVEGITDVATSTLERRRRSHRRHHLSDVVANEISVYGDAFTRRPIDGAITPSDPSGGVNEKKRTAAKKKRRPPLSRSFFGNSSFLLLVRRPQCQDFEYGQSARRSTSR